MLKLQRRTGWRAQRPALLRGGARAAIVAACLLAVAGCGLPEFGDPVIPPPPPPPAG